MSMSPVPELVAELAAGRMIVLVDEEDRENEGDVVLAAEHVSAEAVNFMAKHARGLVCLALTRERCERLQLPPMTSRNGTPHGTAFTVSIEASEGVTTGISAADRARTVRAAVARGARPSDLVQPGHVFPLQAQDGGVLMRAGHTEAGCDLAGMAGLAPAAVICEVMNDDGSMARLPDLQRFARHHEMKIGAIADLIAFRSQHESMVTRVGERSLATPSGRFDSVVYRDRVGGVHLALRRGRWQHGDEVLVRVHEPFTAMDLLDVEGDGHSWPLARALEVLQRAERAVAVLLNYGGGGGGVDAVLRQALGTDRDAVSAKRSQMDLRTYGIGAQILRDLGVGRMKLLGSPRRMPSLTGYGLEVVGFTACA